MGSGAASTGGSTTINGHAAAGAAAVDPKDKFRRCAVQPGTICCEQLVQEGTYGRVYSGTLQQQSTGAGAGELVEALIKTVVGKNFRYAVLSGARCALCTGIVFNAEGERMRDSKVWQFWGV